MVLVRIIYCVHFIDDVASRPAAAGGINVN